MAVVNLYISIISLNVNRWNLSIKRHRLDGFLKKRTICCLQETYFSSKDTHTLKVKEWKMIFQGNGNQKMVKPYLYPIKETSSQKLVNKRQTRLLHNDKRVNTSLKYYNSKYIYTQHWSTLKY